MAAADSLQVAVNDWFTAGVNNIEFGEEYVVTVFGDQQQGWIGFTLPQHLSWKTAVPAVVLSITALVILVCIVIGFQENSRSKQKQT